MRAPALLLPLVIGLVSLACGPTVDLAKALTLTEVVTGWHDAGDYGRFLSGTNFPFESTMPMGSVTLSRSRCSAAGRDALPADAGALGEITRGISSAGGVTDGAESVDCTGGGNAGCASGFGAPPQALMNATRPTAVGDLMVFGDSTRCHSPGCSRSA